MRQARAIAALALVVAGLMLGLAVPRLFGAVAASPHGTVVALLDQPDLVSDAALARARAAFARALYWHEGAQYSADLGALDLASALRGFAAGDEASARRALAASITHHRQSLAAAPLQAYVWTRLAQAELRDTGGTPAAARALAMAIEAAPWEPALITARIGLALRDWSALEPSLGQALDGQILHAARFYPMALARLTRQYRAQEQILRVLDRDADLLRRFSLAYSRI